MSTTPQPGDTSPADPGPTPFTPLPIERQIKCIERELAMRRSVYAKRVGDGKMTAEAAREEFDAMRSVHRTLVILRARCGDLTTALNTVGLIYDAAEEILEACAAPLEASAYLPDEMAVLAA